MKTLRKFSRFAILPAVLLLVSFSSSKLIKTKLEQGITVSLPTELKPMIPDDIALRFPSVRKPIGAFTDENRLVDFSVNISATQWPDNDLAVAQKFFKAGIQNMYNKVDFISEGIYEVHKKKYIYFELNSRINGGKVRDGYQQPIQHYTYIQYLIEPKRSLVFSFHCPQDQQQEWQTVAKEVMRSVYVK